MAQRAIMKASSGNGKKPLLYIGEVHVQKAKEIEERILDELRSEGVDAILFMEGLPALYPYNAFSYRQAIFLRRAADIVERLSKRYAVAEWLREDRSLSVLFNNRLEKFIDGSAFFLSPLDEETPVYGMDIPFVVLPSPITLSAFLPSLFEEIPEAERIALTKEHLAFLLSFYERLMDTFPEFKGFIEFAIIQRSADVLAGLSREAYLHVEDYVVEIDRRAGSCDNYQDMLSLIYTLPEMLNDMAILSSLDKYILTYRTLFFAQALKSVVPHVYGDVVAIMGLNHLILLHHIYPAEILFPLPITTPPIPISGEGRLLRRITPALDRILLTAEPEIF